MSRFRSCSLGAALALASPLAAQVTTEGVVAVGGGGALHDGDRPQFQRLTQHRKEGWGGIEELRITGEGKDSIFKLEARALLGDADYRLLGRFEKTDKFYVEAGFSQFRVYYDGSGGYFRPTDTEFTLFDEDLSLKRGRIWAEAGVWLPAQTLLRFRYERRTRDGRKDSTMWGDSNLVGTFGTRSVAPAFYDLDEATHTFSVDLGNDTQPSVKWGVGARYQETELNDKRWSRRRPFETADRQITSKDETKNDLFAVHGFYLRQLNERLTLSAGAMRTDLDTNIAGSRIYGQTFDPVFDPAYLRRQQRDEGFYDLHGAAELRQTVLNANAVYLPAKHWSVRPSLRFENLHQKTIADFIETNIGAGPAFAAIIEEAEAHHDKTWNELSEALELRFTGVPKWTFSAEGLWVQGDGDLQEERALHGPVVTIDRDMEYERLSQKYSFTTNWYARPGFTFAAQYYLKRNDNEYDARRDNTPAGTADRYPAFITDQDFETHDINLRVSWRPRAALNLVSRYDHQQSRIESNEAGLAVTTSSKVRSHILSQSVTWSPAGRYYVSGSINVTYDQMNTPAIAFVQHADNNYVNGSIGGGCTVGKLDDVYVDYSWFNARNFIDRSQLTLPYGLSQQTQAGSITWLRRQTEHLIYTLKYGYVSNRDLTWAGRGDFEAHVLYGRVQYRF